MNEQKILIIEDDKEISAMLVEFLEQNGFGTVAAYNGTDGLNRALEGGFVLILLDLMLPYKSGDEVLREIRRVSDVPVIILSAKSLTADKVQLLTLGSDDYLTKPFDLNELLARIRVNIKRYSGAAVPASERVTYGSIALEPNSKTVAVSGQTLDLTAKEYALLQLMLSSPSRVFSKQNLYESVWGEQYAYDNDTINTHISNLRKKLKEAGSVDPIETVWGMGYKLKALATDE
jgi:DNA-binding response OmpR family regulator